MNSLDATSPNVIHDRLFVLDLDRCLITEHAYRLFEETVIQSGLVNIDAFRVARRESEKSGGSFDSLAWLRSQQSWDDKREQRMINAYIAAARQKNTESLLAEGARQMLDVLAIRNIPHLILTYGGQTYQKAKIQAADLDNVDHVIIHYKNKALWIADCWKPELGCFEVNTPCGIKKARNIILIDDKAISFQGLLQEHTKGYWVHGTNLLASQAGKVPKNVIAVRTLTEVLRLEDL